MTRILLITVGSRGDAEPLCSLAASLASLGDCTVHLFLQKDLAHLAPHHKSVSCHELPFTQMEFYKYAASPSRGADHPNPRVGFVGAIADTICQLVLPCFNQIMDATLDGKIHAVVASSLARQLGMVVAKACGDIPLYLIQLQPMVPTKDFPHYSKTEECVDALMNSRCEPSDENLESYVELERFQYDFVKEALEKLYSDADTGSSIPEFADLLSMLTGTSKDEVFMVNCFSNQLIPKCNAGEKVLHVGAISDSYIPNDWKPPENLVEFLDSLDEPPIGMGYGSMPFDKVQVLLDALQQSNRPAVLVGSAMLQQEHRRTEWVHRNVYCIASAPYAWLLPRCAMMFSHGGAGVVHATLRAGIPAIISPLIGDQFFYAKLLEAKSLGVQGSSNLSSLSVKDIVTSITKADKCASACKQMGNDLRSGTDGATVLANILTSRHNESGSSM